MALNKSNSSRLVLGTAQLGMAYGIANKTGRPDLQTAEQIIQTAWQNGIHEFDTAQGYGQSEEVLGHCLSELGITEDTQVITKFDPNLDHLNGEELSITVDESLVRLRISRLAGALLHREEYLDLWEKGLGEILIGFVKDGRVDRIGVSVYSPEKATQALKTEGISMVQLPSNLLDRRFERAGVFKLAEEEGKQIYVRSVFLQGLLLMESGHTPVNIPLAGEMLKSLEAFSQETGLSKADVALGYAKQAYPKAKIIIGVETPEQLKDNLESWQNAIPLGFVERTQEEFVCVDERILNPALWPN